MSDDDKELVDDSTEESTGEQESPLSMSDDDFINEPMPDEEPAPTAEDTTESEEDDTSDDTSNSDDDVVESEEEEQEDSSTQKAESEPDDEAEEETKPDTVDTSKQSEVDYKAQYERLLAPFRANGKDMQVHNVDDAINLMQQGANYNKKMAGLKPNLKLMKMLQNNDLLDEEKLSFLIDLDKKNPEAIQKFIKDSGVDPLEIDTEKDTEYNPNSYTVNDKEVELDAVLDNIRDTQSFDKTVDVISNKWDASSKKVLLEQPDIIEVINDHIGSGIYDQITHVVENERMLGRLKGLSDLEAYKQVGDAIQTVNGFAQQQQPSVNEGNNNPAHRNQDDPKLKDRKRAASSTKSKVANKATNNDFNPLAMSDEEFEKAMGNQLF